MNLLRQEKEEELAAHAPKSVRNGKARELAEAEAGEELDIAEEMTTDVSKGKKRPNATKKPSMWGTYRRGRNGDAQHAYQDDLNATTSSSEEEGEVETSTSQQNPKANRPRIKRATTGWNALREKIKGGSKNKPEANELNETLEGHRQSISLSNSLIRPRFAVQLLTSLATSPELTTELALGTLPMCVVVFLSTIFCDNDSFVASLSRLD